jgi:hypothetical protein
VSWIIKDLEQALPHLQDVSVQFGGNYASGGGEVARGGQLTVSSS